LLSTQGAQAIRTGTRRRLSVSRSGRGTLSRLRRKYEIAAPSSNPCDRGHRACRLGLRAGCTGRCAGRSAVSGRSLRANYSLPQAPAGGPDCRRAHDQPRLPRAWVADRRPDGGIGRLVVGVVPNPKPTFTENPRLCLGPRRTRLQQPEPRARRRSSRYRRSRRGIEKSGHRWPVCDGRALRRGLCRHTVR